MNADLFYGRYYIENVLLADCYTKLYKVERLEVYQRSTNIKEVKDLFETIKNEIADGESTEEIRKNVDYYQREEEIERLSTSIASDKLSLGKPQPENLEQALQKNFSDYYEIIIRSTLKANYFNEKTKEAEIQAREILENKNHNLQEGKNDSVDGIS